MKETRVTSDGMHLNQQVGMLEGNAELLVKEGKHDEARRVYEYILGIAPNNQSALTFVIHDLITRGELDAAQNVVENAIRRVPDEARWHQRLGFILRLKGYHDGALKAFTESLKRKPTQPLTWLQRGDVQYFLGLFDEAVCSYYAAEALIGDLGEHAAGKPAHIANVFRNAGAKLAERRRAVVEEFLAPLKQQCAGDDFSRCEEAISHICGTRAPEYADPLQRPTFCYFPGMASKPFYETKEVESLNALEDAFDDIRQEVLSFMEVRSPGARPYVNVPRGDEKQWSELNGSDNWSAVHLFRGGERIVDNCSRFPKTEKAIRQLSGCDIPGQAPEAFFSILLPGTHIPPHHGIANYKLAVHLPLVIPGKCGIRVGDVTRMWKPGQCLVFDDSFEHEAWNRSDEIRIVLILEVWHPDLAEFEKEALRRTITGLSVFDERYSKLVGRPA